MHKCAFCDYTSSRKYNLDRHIKNRHNSPQNVNPAPQNVTPHPQNVTPAPQNVTPAPQIVSHVDETQCDRKTCGKCGKIFSRSDSMKRHMLICDGITYSNECSQCGKVLSSRQSKYRHMKTCTVPQQPTLGTVIDSQIISGTNNTLNATTNNTTNNNTQNAITNNTNNNTLNAITNSNNNTTNNTLTSNNVHYHINNFGSENVSYLTTEFIEHCFEAEYTGVRTIMEQIYFNNEHPENHNVRLKSLKNAIAEVYNDNKWIPKGLHETIENMIMKSVTLITSTIATTTEPTPSRLNTMGNIQGMKNNRDSRNRLFDSARGNLVARRQELEEEHQNEP